MMLYGVHFNLSMKHRDIYDYDHAAVDPSMYIISQLSQSVIAHVPHILTQLLALPYHPHYNAIHDI